VVAAIGTTHVVDGRVKPHLVAYRAGFVVAAVVMLVGAATALVVRDADAAETMRPRDQDVAPLVDAAPVESAVE
jgi:uncharacterized integral membrane protein